MGRTDTNRQWTTYRILDATIDNPDLADPLNLGATGANEGKGFILWGDTSAAKIEWDEVNDRLLTTSATIRFGTTDKLEFRDANHYIQSDAANDLMVNAGTNLNLAVGGTDVISMAAASVTIAQDTVLAAGKSLGLSGAGYFQAFYINMYGFRANDGTASFSIADSTGIITVATDVKLQFRSASHYIQSDAANDLMVNAGTNLMLGIGGADEVHLTATALSPAASGGNALGTGSLMWSNLFLKSGAVINFNNGNVTVTHSAGLLTLSGALTVTGAIIGSSTLAIAGNTTFNGDVVFRAGASWYWTWNKTTKTMETTASHLRLGDGSALWFGDDKDTVLTFDGTKTKMMFLAHDTGIFEIGTQTKAIDWKWWLGAGGGYMLMDVGTKRLTLEGMDLKVSVGRKIMIGTGDTAYIHSASTGRLDITAPARIHLNNDVVLLTSMKLYIGSTAGGYIYTSSIGGITIAGIGVDGVVTISTSSGAKSGINLNGGAATSVKIGGGAQFNLPVTDTDGSVKGEIWVDASDSRLKFYNGAAVKTLTES